MAKNIKSNVAITIKRALNEPAMPYIAENKLDSAMYELKRSQINLLNFRKYLLMSITINLIMGAYIWMK